MGFINLFASTEEHIKVKNSQLVFSDSGKQFPLEDINCLLIDNLQTNISTYAINAVIKAGGTIILCDEKHLPTNLIVPNQGYFQRLTTLNAQLSISKPKIKRLWQQIIVAKITNQAACLQLTGCTQAVEKLQNLAQNVASYDSDNKEAEAARLYFQSLFTENFKRSDEQDERNGALNYGYAIVRSLIARHLCARGFECAFGIFHRSQLNAFNLADDLIEPFRPAVDLYVYTLLQQNLQSPVSSLKRQLFGLVNMQVNLQGQQFSLSYAVEKFVENIHRYYLQEGEEVCFPTLVAVEQHQYC